MKVVLRARGVAGAVILAMAVAAAAAAYGQQDSVRALPPGNVAWVDLAAPDVDAAKEFYAEILGWTYEEAAGGYTLARFRDRAAAGLLAQPAAERERGAPAAWELYFAVDDVDAAVRMVPELGGTVIEAPVEVELADGEVAGRMAVVEDRGGARLRLWQTVGFAGAQITRTPGSMAWWELLTEDPEGAVEFYTALFGYGTQVVPYRDGGDYTIMLAGRTMAAGIGPLTAAHRAAGIRPQWAVYFDIAGIDRFLEQATAAGAAVVRGPQRPPFAAAPVSGVGKLTDPHGALFGVSDVR